MGDNPRRRLLQIIRSLPTRPYDFVVFAVGAAIIVAFSMLAIERGGPATRVEIQSDEGTFVYSLDQDQELRFDGPLGESVVQIQDGSVRFVASPCRDKICIAAGKLSASGQWAACLPNRVFVTVAGAREDAATDVDATAF